MSRDKLGKFQSQVYIRRGGSFDKRQLIHHIGQPLAFPLPRRIQPPQSIRNRFVSHSHLGGHRFFTQMHNGTSQLKIRWKIIREIQPQHRFSLHVVSRITFKIHTDRSTCIDDTLIQDGNYSHRIVNRVIGVFRQRPSTSRDTHRSPGDIHRTKTYLIGRRGTVLSLQTEFIFLRQLLGHRQCRVIQLRKCILIGQFLIAEFIGQMLTERFHHREEDTTVLRIDRIPFDKIEESVTTHLVLTVQTIQIHHLKQRYLIDFPFRNVSQIHTRSITQIGNIQRKLLRLHLISIQWIDAFHHQIPAIGVRRIRGVFQ